MNHDQQNRPSFFALIKGEIYTKQLKVPPDMVTNLGEELWKNELIILIGPSGEKWQVSILKKENDMYLQNIGWEKFMKDNSVVNKEFLFFTYNGENRFQVQIFGLNGLERPCFKKEEEVTAEAPVVVKRKRGRPRKNPVAEMVCASKEKEAPKTTAPPVAKIEKGSTVRKNPAPEKLCVKKKKEKEEAAEAIVAKRKKDGARKNAAAKRVCVKKEKEKEEAVETKETKRMKGRPRKSDTTPDVIIID